jgi:hypothetical protein
MQHVPTIDAARRAFRAVICPVCPQRPPGSEVLPSTIARSCEPSCALFEHIGKLKELAEHPRGSRTGDFELQVRNEICHQCCHRQTAGDYCAERLNRTCPLSCFEGQALAIFAGLVAAEQIARERAVQRQPEPASGRQS